MILSTPLPRTKSWFLQVRDLCLQYGLPSPLHCLDSPLPKAVFKKMVKRRVVEYWEDLLKREAAAMKSLKYFKSDLYSLTTPHYIWSTAANSPYECSKSTVLARMASGRFRTEALCRHWSANKNGYCRAPTCQLVYGTLEHLLVSCPALDGVRERLYCMWLERSVMFPPLHSQIREILTSNEQEKVQFILEPLAFPLLASCFKIHGAIFIQQLAYLTRTFAYYIDKEYKKIVQNLGSDHPTPQNNQPTNTYEISVAVTDDYPAVSTIASTGQPHQSHLDLPGLPDVYQEEECHPSAACQLSHSRLYSRAALGLSANNANPSVPAPGLPDVRDVPVLGLHDVLNQGMPDVPSLGLPDVIGPEQLPLTVVPTIHSTNSLRGPVTATQISCEQTCSNCAFPSQLFFTSPNHVGGDCAGGVASQLVICRSEYQPSPTSGAAWDIDGDIDKHSDSDGSADHV